MPPITYTWRVATAVVSAVVMLFALAVSAPTALAAEKISVRALKDGNGSLVVTVNRMTSKRPVRIDWGDGDYIEVKVHCTKKRAAKQPKRCSTTKTHSYGPGLDTDLTVTVNGKTIAKTPILTSGVPEKPAPTAPKPTGGEALGDGWQDVQIASVNDTRASVGQGPVQRCARLEAAAQKYAEVMAANKWFEHEGPDGRRPSQRVTAEGYTWMATGENIAYGYKDNAAVMTGWINSPGHYANIVNPAYEHVGVGAAKADTGVIYWAQEFGAGGTC